MGMRLPVLLLALPLAACGVDARSAEAEAGAVYEALLFDHCCIDRALVQEVTDTVGLAGRNERADGELTEGFSRDVLQAVADLRRRSGTTRPLPDSLRVTGRDRRLTADSAQALLQHIRRDHVRRLPDSASIVLISGVGFSRDGRVAVVRITEVCGQTCGGVTLRALRRHPRGWVAAEVVWAAIF